MNTKHLFILLSSVLFSFSVKGQGLINPAIQSKMDAFITHSNNKEWDKAFDQLYPKLFTRVAKKDLVDLMLGMESDGMSLEMKNTRITSTSVPVEEGSETFVRVEYTADLFVKIKQEGLYDSPKAIQAIEEQFIASYGKTNVKWDANLNEFQIRSHKAMMAIDSPANGWRLVEINMDQPELMQFLFSPSIMDALVRVE